MRKLRKNWKQRRRGAHSLRQRRTAGWTRTACCFLVRLAAAALPLPLPLSALLVALFALLCLTDATVASCIFIFIAPLCSGRETRVANFIVHCGVIDVLQTYNTGRKFQHHFVGAFTDAVSLSSVPAPLYRDRMKLFMAALVFAPSENVPASLAEAVASGYVPKAEAELVSGEDKDVLESFEDFMASPRR